MKTTKYSLITALLLLGAILFGQAERGPYLNAGYAEKSSRFETLVNNFLSMSERIERKGYREPVAYLTYTLNQAEVVYEEQYGTEAWMASPFDCGVAEVRLEVEDWMTSPFESSITEAELNVEPWMTVPFQYSGLELDPLIEKWMTRPFEAAEFIEIESWMTAAF